MKRCYGCDKLIWPWSRVLKTKQVGVIHAECVLSVSTKIFREECSIWSQKLYLHLLEKAKKELGVEEDKKGKI